MPARRACLGVVAGRVDVAAPGGPAEHEPTTRYRPSIISTPVVIVNEPIVIDRSRPCQQAARHRVAHWRRVEDSRAAKIPRVPSVPMNGGRLARVTRMPLTSPVRPRRQCPPGARPAPAAPTPSQVRHDQLGEDHGRADRQVDAGGEDDHRLAQGQRADDRNLLEHDRQVDGNQEPVVDEAEDRRGARSTISGPSDGCACSSDWTRFRRPGGSSRDTSTSADWLMLRYPQQRVWACAAETLCTPGCGPSV